MTRWKITPVPTQRQVKEIRRLPNVVRVSRDGEFSIVHHTATYGNQQLLSHSLGDLGFEVVGGGWTHADANEGMDQRPAAYPRMGPEAQMRRSARMS